MHGFFSFFPVKLYAHKLRTNRLNEELKIQWSQLYTHKLRTNILNEELKIQLSQHLSKSPV